MTVFFKQNELMQMEGLLCKLHEGIWDLTTTTAVEAGLSTADENSATKMDITRYSRYHTLQPSQIRQHRVLMNDLCV